MKAYRVTVSVDKEKGVEIVNVFESFESVIAFVGKNMASLWNGRVPFPHKMFIEELVDYDGKFGLQPINADISELNKELLTNFTDSAEKEEVYNG